MIAHRLKVRREEKYSFPAGAVTLAVVHREFTEATMLPYEGRPGVQEILDKIRDENYYDRGASVYVYETASGRDFLRFDCLEREPHYHYHHLHALRDQGLEIELRYQKIDGHAESVVMNGMWHQVPFDQAANGDIREWMLDCLSRRLAAMLREAGADGLAAAFDPGAVRAVLEDVRRHVYADVEG